MSTALKLTGHHKDLGGGFMVRRLLPAAQQQSVGPFIFFDHFGPVTEQPGTNHDVRPHPHIGLATVTYLFEGAMMHRDSLGSAQRIEPGAINWMTAGRGIVHSERAPEDLRGTAYVNHGLQLWAALPKEFEETAPAFSHTPAQTIPATTVDGAAVRILVGEAFGRTSPVKTFSRTLYLDVALAAGTPFTLPPLAEQMAIYSVDGDLLVDGEPLAMHTLATLTPGAAVQLSAGVPTRLVVIGGDALDAHRFMWWNFVSSRKERIVQAGEDWEAQAMGQVPGETEFIPLPERKFTAGG
ncbi:Pirin-related protein [Polaromonas sp. CF318]|uniref:pirin family protein n=1 Tax=Polaromonas sp. CF318 TaxID=1144318 RepID=UPI000271019A|nr:pirin family protein [Polaromonas sp. CF318]EJL80535.1 Pirin-related protein [Polaromonas sp. CF318]